MPSKHRPLYVHICTNCGKKRCTTHKHNPSGLCNACAFQVVSQARHAALKRSLHFSPGALYPDQMLQRFWARVDKNMACACHAWEDRCWPWTGRLFPGSLYGAFQVNGRSIGAHRFAYQSEHGTVPAEIFVLHEPPCILKHCVRHLYAGTPQDNSNDAKIMERFVTGERHAETHNGYKALPRGDKHWTHSNPEKLPRARDHWTHTSPEKVLRGEGHAQKHRGYISQPRGEDHARLHHNYVSLPRGSQHHSARFEDQDILTIRSKYMNGMSAYALAKQYACAPQTIHRIVQYKTWKHLP